MSGFFQEQQEQSLIKSRIVAKYFSAWANVILSVQKRFPRHEQTMAYIDLFAGPGRYDDQSKSTPLLVLETILTNAELKNRMVTLFNDKDTKNVESLKNAINHLNGIKTLRHEPAFYNMEVGEEITNLFQRKKLVPTFFFVDPWGYKGLSLNLVSSIIKDWGCDCVFFFNYNRVSMGINNESVKHHMASLFGEEHLNFVRSECDKAKNPTDREAIIIQELCTALKRSGSKYVLPFRFKDNNGKRTTHHLIFLSKDFKGYDIMKNIMHIESTSQQDGVASFEYNPPLSQYAQDSLLYSLSRPLHDLENMLLDDYAGQTIDFESLYECHSVDKPYVTKNYQDVFKKLLADGKITAISRKTNKPPKANTFSKEMRITFLGGVI